MSRDGEQLLVTAQLINAATGYHLWSKRYERSHTDVFAIQQEISEAVATLPRSSVPHLPAKLRESPPSASSHPAKQ